MFQDKREKNMNENDNVIERTNCFNDLEKIVKAAINKLENDQTMPKEEKDNLMKRLKNVAKCG